MTNVTCKSSRHTLKCSLEEGVEVFVVMNLVVVGRLMRMEEVEGIFCFQMLVDLLVDRKVN